MRKLKPLWLNSFIPRHFLQYGICQQVYLFFIPNVSLQQFFHFLYHLSLGFLILYQYKTIITPLVSQHYVQPTTINSLQVSDLSLIPVSTIRYPMSFFEHYVGSGLPIVPQTYGHIWLYSIIFLCKMLFFLLSDYLNSSHVSQSTSSSSSYNTDFFYASIAIIENSIIFLNHILLACSVYVKVIPLSYFQQDVSLLKVGEGF